MLLTRPSCAGLRRVIPSRSALPHMMRMRGFALRGEVVGCLLGISTQARGSMAGNGDRVFAIHVLCGACC